MRFRKLAIGAAVIGAALAAWGLMAPRATCAMGPQVRVFALLGYFGVVGLCLGSVIYLTIEEGGK